MRKRAMKEEEGNEGEGNVPSPSQPVPRGHRDRFPADPPGPNQVV